MIEYNNINLRNRNNNGVRDEIRVIELINED